MTQQSEGVGKLTAAQRGMLLIINKPDDRPSLFSVFREEAIKLAEMGLAEVVTDDGNFISISPTDAGRAALSKTGETA